MSKLKIIRAAFENNPNIDFGLKEFKSFGEGCTGLVHDAHEVIYVVAPKVATYSVSQLNRWFKGLIPNYLSLQPVNNEEFRCYDRQNKELRLGHFRFDETGLGRVETLITRVERITDEDFLKDIEGFKEGMRVRIEHRKVELGRMIRIYGCPDTDAMALVLERGGALCVPVKRIEE